MTDDGETADFQITEVLRDSGKAIECVFEGGVVVKKREMVATVLREVADMVDPPTMKDVYRQIRKSDADPAGTLAMVRHRLHALVVIWTGTMPDGADVLHSIRDIIDMIDRAPR